MQRGVKERNISSRGGSSGKLLDLHHRAPRLAGNHGGGPDGAARIGVRVLLGFINATSPKLGLKAIEEESQGSDKIS